MTTVTQTDKKDERKEEVTDPEELEEESFEESDITKRLKTLGEDPKNYLVTDDFAIYRGNNVDYKLIKKEFPKIVKEKIGVSELKAVTESKKIAIFLNLGGFSSTRKNVVKVEGTTYTLDELTKKLELINYSKTTAKTTDRKFPTLTRVCIAFADETRAAIKRNPQISRFAELGDLGFVYSWACSGLTEMEVKRLFWKQLDLVQSWTPGRASNPKRFPEKNGIILHNCFKLSKDFFFEKIKYDYNNPRPALV